MLSVKKRDGRVVPFDTDKIYNAIKKAMNMSGKISETVAHKRTDSQRHCFGFGFSCHRNGTRHGNGNYRRSYKRIVNSGLRHTDRGRCIIVRHDNLINYHGEQLPNYLYCFISSSARSSPSSFAFCKFCKQSCFFLVSP